jgi:hypothetical protein
MTSRPDILDSSLSGTTVILIQRGRKWYQEGRRSAGENALLRHRFLLAKMLEMWRCYHPRPYTCMHMHRRRSSTAICGTGGTAWGCGAKALDTLRLALTWGVRRASGIRWRRGLVPLAFEDTGVRACHRSCRVEGIARIAAENRILHGSSLATRPTWAWPDRDKPQIPTRWFWRFVSSSWCRAMPCSRGWPGVR